MEDRPRCGKTLRIPPGRAAQLLKSPRTRSIRKAARHLEKVEGRPCSTRTMWLAVKRDNLVYRVRPLKPLLTPTVKEDRLTFALVARSRNYWHRVVASDEKTFSVLTQVRGEWVDKGKEPSPRLTRKWPGGVKVWCGTSWNGKTRMHVLPKSMKGEDYLTFIREKAEPDLLELYPLKTQPPIWLQDREGFHTAKVVENYLRKSPCGPSWTSPPTPQTSTGKRTSGR